MVSEKEKKLLDILMDILCDYDVWFEDIEDLADEIMELFK